MAPPRPGLRRAPADRRAACLLAHELGLTTTVSRSTIPVRSTIVQGGRAKAYRPMPAADRRRAFEAGLAAYANGDFFEAHELWEPAWMGTRDLAERELIQGLIKLAAAFVHQVRGNPRGVEKNLCGARARIAAGAAAGRILRVDAAALVASIDAFAPGSTTAIPIPRSAPQRS